MNVDLYWENIIEYFEAKDLSLSEVDDERRMAVTHIGGENGTFRAFVWLYEKLKALTLNWYLSINIPSNKRHLVLDLLNRLNCETFMGKFTMDSEDGVLVFRITVSVNETPFSVEQFDDFMQWGTSAVDEHYPKFMLLMHGDYTVNEVLEEKKKPQLRLVEKTEEQGELFEEDEVQG